MPRPATTSLIDGPYVEYSKIEVPKSVKDAIYNEHISICPKNANITEDEIQEMINESRNEKKVYENSR